jgi:hypothetical protein
LDTIIPDIIPEVTKDLFEKGVQSPKYVELYCRLCLRLTEKFNEPFRKGIIDLFQASFSLLPNEDWDDEERVKFNQRRKGTVIFITSLMKAKVVYPRIVLLCLGKLTLVDTDGYPIIDNITNFCDILINSFPDVKTESVKAEFKKAFLMIVKLKTEKPHMPQRIVFKIEDALTIENKYTNQSR